MLCKLCDGLSISLLIDLAETEFCVHGFPQQAYYHHQPSYADLVQSAGNGCSLCDLILRGFQEVITSDMYCPTWEGMTRGEAALQIESDGEICDIKICINADHLYSDGNLDQVELFDVLMVQAGTPERIPTSEPSYSEDNYIPLLRLALSVPPGKPCTVGKYRVGRFQLEPDLGSERNYRIAKIWLEDCCILHRSCPRKLVSKLPTRVIDVGLHGEQNPRLFLSEGFEAKYAALSHCWGGVVSPLLTRNNLGCFQKEILLCDLPANFRDAISITRQLGIQYLWIDCLCIIQDSKEDWEFESKLMGSIYRDTLITISAATACRSIDGIVKNPPDAARTPERAISLRLTIDNNSSEMVQVSLKGDEESFRELLDKSPLTKRGWALQESILSPRILWYGKRQIHWQCQHGFQSADGVPSGNLMPHDLAHPEIAEVLYSLNQRSTEAPDLNLLLNDYYQLVRQYSSRVLSFDSDKLPAFSGLAAILHPVLGGDYLAGIWSVDFKRGLLWHSDVGECRHSLSRQAPSWSWAVTNDPVLFLSYTRKDSPLSPGPNEAQLLSHNIEREQNYYGQVGSGCLTIAGFVKKLSRSSQVVNLPASDLGIGRIFFDEPETYNIEGFTEVIEVKSGGESYLLSLIDARLQYAVDRPGKTFVREDIDFDLISVNNYTVLLVEEIPEDFEGNTITRATCLILMGTTEANTYNRAGLLSIRMFEDDFMTWLQTWERKTITIV